MRGKYQQGVTLIELLVVIGIIGVLATLLLSAVSKARELGRATKCTSVFKQWVLGMELYLNDNSYLPPESADDDQDYWDDAIAPGNEDIWYNVLALEMGVNPVAKYAALNENPMDFYRPSSMFHCPSAKFSDQAAAYPQFSIAMNSKLIVPPVLATQPSDILEPNRTPYFTDSGVPSERPLPGQKDYNGQPHAYASRFVARHNGRGTIGMADGHVERFRAKDVVDMNPNNVGSYGKAIWPNGMISWRADPAESPNR